MKRNGATCNRDCFNCVFEDCVIDGVSAEDYDYARMVEREFVFPKTQEEKKLAAKQKAYREANREELAAKQKAYREANREELAAKQKAYYEANREELAAKQKAWVDKNREKVNRYQREYRKRKRMEGQA